MGMNEFGIFDRQKGLSESCRLQDEVSFGSGRDEDCGRHSKRLRIQDITSRLVSEGEKKWESDRP